jgi:TIR domain/Pentapeptide repeats (8 copies)
MERCDAIKLLQSGPKGVAQWNKWRIDSPEEALPDLTDADFRESNLGGVDFRRARLERAEFWDANLKGAILIGADLSHADLTDADLRFANLSNANLYEAWLSGAILSSAILQNADLANASTRGTIWGDVNLGAVQGLDEIRHLGPSSIGLEVLLECEDLPEFFLLGCGLPDTILPTIRSLPNSLQPIQFYSCFISYSQRDDEFARRLHGRLQQQGLRAWFAPEDLRGGKKLHHQIDEAIRLHDKLLLVLSEHSMGSEWVKTEICKARKREVAEHRQVLFPIRLIEFNKLREWQCFDSDEGMDIAREIREYFIPDFSNWKNPDGFEDAFSKLAADLQKSVARL